MTQAEIILRVRALANEIGTTSGFWSDTNALYKYLDTAQKELIDMLYFKQMELRKVDQFFEYYALNSIKTTKLFDLLTTQTDYSFSSMSVSDFRYPYDFQVGLSSATRYGATLVNQAELDWRQRNSYETPGITDPIYYISLGNQGISVLPAPTTNVTNGGRLTYYKTPAEVTAAANVALTDETHIALIYLTTSLAFVQDGQKAKADKFYQMYLQSLSSLT